MSFSANINGVTVESDMDCTSISNNRVAFANGSWCNVRTGEVSVRGNGTIRMNGVSHGTSSGERKTVGPKSYTASSLVVNSVHLQVRIEPHSSPDIEVTIVAPEDVAQSVQCAARSGMLMIEGGTSGSFSVTSDSVTIKGAAVKSSFVGIFRTLAGSIGAQTDDDYILVKVPLGTGIELQGTATADTIIGSIGGSLVVNTSGSGDVQAKSVSRLRVSRVGSGDTIVDHVDGDVIISNSGSGDTKIAAGRIGTLQVQITGSGGAVIDCTAQFANLSLTGSGKIRVTRVINEPVRHCTGSGSIMVKHIGEPNTSR